MSDSPTDDETSLREMARDLYTAVLSDVLDERGLTGQAVRPFIRPLDPDSVMFGRARTGLYALAYEVAEGANPFEVEIALVDDLKPGDVAVFACDGPSERIAPWGELLTTAARCRGAAGCLTDGLVRDTRHILRMGFPVFHGGIAPLSSAGRAEMIAMDVVVECGGVRVAPGDYVFGDADGVVIIPQAMAGSVMAEAHAKVASEDATRRDIEAGMLLRDAYAKYGVL